MELNRQLSQTQLQLAHSERLAAAGQVAANVAHRIGTPLHSILGHLYRLRRDTSLLRQEERVKIIESQVQRVVQVIQELLDMVRKPAPRMEPVLLDQLLEDALSLITPGASLRGIKVRMQYEPQLPTIMGDARQLQEVFLNLFTNAMDAMQDGGELSISANLNGIKTHEAKVVAVTVRDTGHGIAEADLPRIFDPFFTTKEKGKGTGLGLSICRDIIKIHGGEIHVSSHVGTGTRFTVTFPVNCHETT
jgi:signal transduction histidine kinase